MIHSVRGQKMPIVLSFSHHCNALIHIKEMNCSPKGTTHTAEFGHFWSLRRASVAPMVWLDPAGYLQKRCSLNASMVRWL